MIHTHKFTFFKSILFVIDNRIWDKVAKAFAEALKTNTTVTKINLRYDSGNLTPLRGLIYKDSIEDEGAKALVEMLKTNTTLTEIGLEDIIII